MRGDGIHPALGQPLNEDLAPKAQCIFVQPQAIPHQVEDQDILEEQYLQLVQIKEEDYFMDENTSSFHEISSAMELGL